jgi:SAM-dependent methyltransferase
MNRTDLSEDRAAATLEDMIAGYQRTQALCVAAKLGLADQLAGGAQRAEALAVAVGAEPRALYRLLRALEFLGIVHEPSPGLFSLNAVGQRLRAGVPGSVHDELLMTGEAFFSWWGGLEHSIRSGESSVPGIEGVSSFEYLHRDPEQARRFNRMMSEMIGAMATGVLSAYDFGVFGTVVDVGGGRGTLLSAILESYPRIRGVLFDLPATADEARATIAARGLAGRCKCVVGDFFAAVPAGDCIILSAVISDWDDEKSVAIFKNCRRAIAPEGRLLLIERLLVPEEPAPQSVFMDLQMLVIGGGTGRSAAEYRQLLGAAGFELARVLPTGTARSIFEARPVRA